MQRYFLKKIFSLSSALIVVAGLQLSACSTFTEKDNTPEPSPLAQFTPSAEPKLLWSARAGSGVGDQYLKNAPAIYGPLIYTSSTHGIVTAVDRQNGHRAWQANIEKPIINGPGVGDDIVVVASPKGHIVALDRLNGQIHWETQIEGEALAAPAVDKGKVVIKTIDGQVIALSSKDGHIAWQFQQTEPEFILRAASKPVIYGRDVLLGFANGNLAKLTLDQGQLLWTKAIASPSGSFTIERMIDIDATPIVYNNEVYAASYQGNLASIDWLSGQRRWMKSFSSYTGITGANQQILASDTKSLVWAFKSGNGELNWKQDALKWRKITGPGIHDGYIVVGDAEGFLHWMRPNNGHFAARAYTGGSIYAAPIVKDSVLYALTNNGMLLAYAIN